MALVKFATKVNIPAIGTAFRNLSSTANKNIKKSVFISQSTDVYTNLALEDWLYRNFDFNNHHVLMLWRNDHSIVIGRHQNPWIEANTAELSHISDGGVQLARRNSDGPTVYHDLGILNMTFFASSSKSDCGHNTEVISRALFRSYGIKLKSLSTNTLRVRNLKVSESAVKDNQINSYHHCSLFVSTDKVDRTHSLLQTNTGIKSTAPQPEQLRILNLCEENPKANIDGVLKAVGWEYLRMPANSLKDGGKELANKQNGFQMVNPTENWFPGIMEIRNKFSDWEWCYGKTPRFTVTKSFPVPNEFLNGVNGDLHIAMIVEQGRISDVSLHIPLGLSSTGFSGSANVITGLKNQKFSQDAIYALQQQLCGNERGSLDDKDKFITECVRQVMTCV